MNVHELFHFLVFLSQKGGKETILEEELEFKGIEEEEEEESLIDIDRSSAEGDKDKGEERLWFMNVFVHLLSLCVSLLNNNEIAWVWKKSVLDF